MPTHVGIHNSYEVSPSSGISPILPTLYLMTTTARACVEGTYAACLGDGAVVKSRGPRARSAGRHRHPSTIVRVVRQRSVLRLLAVRSARSSRSSSQPDTPCGLVPHQLISGRRSQRPHQEPPYLGQQAGQTGPFFNYGMLQPVVDAVPCPPSIPSRSADGVANSRRQPRHVRWIGWPRRTNSCVMSPPRSSR
jgi:hypothetical protein